MKPRFSIITPTRNRDGRYEKGLLARCLNSVRAQNYPKNLFQHIIVDDGNDQPIDKTVNGIYRERVNFNIIRHEEPLERYISYNDGMKAVKDGWIVFLDDDDAYEPFYLEMLADAIEKNPEHKVFNYGGLVVNKNGNWVKARGVVRFEQKIGCECESGMIVNGQFAFHKDCLKKSGYMPDTPNLWEGYRICGIPGYGDQQGDKPLGNPWGQDFFIFYQLTRHFISKPLDLYLYICYLRGGE